MLAAIHAGSMLASSTRPRACVGTSGMTINRSRRFLATVPGSFPSRPRSETRPSRSPTMTSLLCASRRPRRPSASLCTNTGFLRPIGVLNAWATEAEEHEQSVAGKVARVTGQGRRGLDSTGSGVQNLIGGWTRPSCALIALPGPQRRCPAPRRPRPYARRRSRHGRDRRRTAERWPDEWRRATEAPAAAGCRRFRERGR